MNAAGRHIHTDATLRTTLELEARCNKALARMAEVESKIAAHEAANVATVAELASLATLAADLKTIWSAPRLMHG